MIAETISARTLRIRPTVMTAPTMMRSCSMPGKPLELGSMSITAVLLFREDGRFCRQVLAAAMQTKERPPRSGWALRSQGGSELLADAEQPVHPGDTGTGQDRAAEGDQHSDAAFGGGGIVTGAR